MQTTVDAVFEEASVPLVRAGHAERGTIFHSTGLKARGRFFAFVRDDDLVVKLPEERVAALLAEQTGRPFDAGKGRPMREWIRLRPRDSRTCAAYLGEAYAFIIAGTPRRPKT